MRLWVPGRKPACLKGHEDELEALSWSPDGRVLATGSRDRTVRLWEPKSGRELACLTGLQGSVEGLTWSPDGKFLRCVNGLSSYIYWHAESGTELERLTRIGFENLAAAFPSGVGAGRLDVSIRNGEAIFSQPDSRTGVGELPGFKSLDPDGNSVNPRTPIAWCPVGIKLKSVDGLTWAGISDSEVYLVRLEGVVSVTRLK